jgi:predicted short-subunit dehydrogenase-like oxidoreductase (DUF2520 family)
MLVSFKIMDIVIIGSGNVASVLGRKFKAAGHQIVQIVSRNPGTASRLAYEWDTESANYMSLLTRTADIYIIAVSDDAIGEVVKEMYLPGKIVAPTAGSVSKDLLKTVTEHYGVFYPLQSLREETLHQPAIPIFVEASDEKTAGILGSLARSISGEQVTVATDQERMKLHVAAVFVNNFTNHLYSLAEAYCKKEGLDFRQLLPLIEETAARISSHSPSSVQTGPAARHDKQTIEQHLDLLKDHPHLKNIYLLMTESIQGWQVSK